LQPPASPDVAAVGNAANSQPTPLLTDRVRAKLIKLGAPLPPYFSSLAVAKQKMGALVSENRYVLEHQYLEILCAHRLEPQFSECKVRVFETLLTLNTI